jgi:sodium-coupled monocarboxylate transporter 8/12
MNSLHVVDYLVLGCYLAAITAIGVRASRGQKNTEDFLLAGKSMGWLLVGISIAASFISGISYIGLPAEVRTHGLGFIVYALAYVFVIPIVLHTILPFYTRQRITTAYEYLEGRFSVAVRQLASGMFILWRIFWIATVIYVPSLVISTVTGMPLIPAVLIVGVLTTVYTSLGGMKAVIWTDFTQFFVMFGGAALAIAFIATAVPGGIAGIWETASIGGRTRLAELSFDPTVRMTLWGALIGGVFANLACFSVDQLIIQRYLSTRSAEELKRTFLLNCAALFLVVGVLSVLGLALFAFYVSRPHALPPSVPPDHVLPYFIAHEFPPGLAGLLIASIFAASMSALSAGINAVTTALYNDFVHRNRPLVNASEGLTAARTMTLAVGCFSTLLACWVGQLGMIMEIAVRLIDGFAGPLLAIFLIGMFFRRVGAGPVLLGAIAGVLLSAGVNFFSPISFLWFPAVGTISTVAATLLLHFMWPARVQEPGSRVAVLRDAD